MEEFIGMVRQNKSQSIIKVIEMGWFSLVWFGLISLFFVWFSLVRLSLIWFSLFGLVLFLFSLVWFGLVCFV